MTPPIPKAKAKKGKQSRPAKSPKGQEQEQASTLPRELQQLLLDIFKNSFAEILESDIQPLLQEVKGHLYNRDFSAAFGRNDYLTAYSARWSPSRALGYLQVLEDLKDHLLPLLQSTDEKNGTVCLGGGAGAEPVAFAGFLSLLKAAKTSEQEEKRLDLAVIDIADWSEVLQKLLHSITTAPPLSKYASAAVKAAAVPLVPVETLGLEFHQHDILNTEFALLRPLLEEAKLITILFTLNELYSASLSLTQRFLLNLTACLKEGAMLLVVDSPGSYSTVSLNGAEKKYPMHWLLDHTLLKQGPKGEPAEWSKVVEEESTWFRLREGLRYPIELEHMRFQLHLYRKGESH
ncbi:hypothetical protein P154DRAFT_427160 [Amniculicola lignicola CBS 123094]|uniref:25S rRNA (Uridine(2843)-N(3))-methyltransferase n=1 Tax=Amniculicola lignicola CBS 123094 TaxID=1392246 RepID=A0A6A5WRP6_9PLEO|nr:hypothetical protein P154DRAFT_427160 [Amniculicola lignicola CBS 123094]